MRVRLGTVRNRAGTEVETPGEDGHDGRTGLTIMKFCLMPHQPPPFHAPIIPDATDTRLNNRIDRQPLDYLKADLIICINALMEMRESGDSMAARTLRNIYLDVECGACGGEGTVLCSHCRGGGTHEYPCGVCKNSHTQTCLVCDGNRVV